LQSHEACLTYAYRQISESANPVDPYRHLIGTL
jgi:hypothetical protein